MASLPLVSMATLFHSVRKEMKIKQKPLPLTLVKDTREPQRNVFLSMKPLPLKKTMIGHFAISNDFIHPDEPEDERIEVGEAPDEPEDEYGDERIEVGEAPTYRHYWEAARIRAHAQLKSRKPTEPYGNDTYFGELMPLTIKIYVTLITREDTTECIVAIDVKTGDVLGTFDFKKPGNVGNDEDPNCQITNMAISEGVKGIDTIMLNSVKKRAKGLGARVVIACVSGSNSSEQRFYEKYGFELSSASNEDTWKLKI